MVLTAAGWCGEPTTGLPVWLGVSCKTESGRLVGFDAPHSDTEELLGQLVTASGLGVINIMHSPITDTGAALTLAKRYWSDRNTNYS